MSDNPTNKDPFLTERETELQEQILDNLINRGLVDEVDEGKANAELTVFAYHLKKIVFEEISDLLLNKANAFEKVEDRFNCEGTFNPSHEVGGGV